MLMDLISPLFPSAFVFIVCLGSISRSFTGVASGATRAALTQHFALQDNAADISAKEGSQEIVATMIGMALGMLVDRITIGHPLAIWFSFLSLTLFHMYANYRAIRCLALNSLNLERSSILVQHFTKTSQCLFTGACFTDTTNFMAFKEAYLENSLLCDTNSKEHLLSVASYYTKARYLLVEKKGIVTVIVHKESSGADLLNGKCPSLLSFWVVTIGTCFLLEVVKPYFVFLLLYLAKYLLVERKESLALLFIKIQVALISSMVSVSLCYHFGL
ncbi:protein root UVB sensitive 3-like [Vicia villosa]|uniref:protein root UVB sensitive 3-like n=1 Tax=Vicia villosa TaxID=3911 RepID=UPI00273BF560|nr:protein root UVB sensitive 3-like [Vicia villosa]